MSTDQAVWPRLVLATANLHKLIELTRILAADHVDVDLAGLNQFPGAPAVAEPARPRVPRLGPGNRRPVLVTSVAAAAGSGLRQRRIASRPGTVGKTIGGMHT